MFYEKMLDTFYLDRKT